MAPWAQPGSTNVLAGFAPAPSGQGHREEMVMDFHTSHLRPDGTTWPPVTPDPPPPPGYVDPFPDADADAVEPRRRRDPLGAGGLVEPRE